MIEFHHHPDNLIYLRDLQTGRVYCASISQFESDLGVLYTGLENGFRERRYKPNEYHLLYTGDTQIGATMPYLLGDSYCESFETLYAAQVQRQAATNQPATPTVNTVRTKRLRDVGVWLAAQLATGYLFSNSVRYACTDAATTTWRVLEDDINDAGVSDANPLTVESLAGVVHELTVSEFRDLRVAIAVHRLSLHNTAMTHRAALQSLDTIDALNNYTIE